MNTYTFRLERLGLSKERPGIREANLEDAVAQISSEIEEGWVVTSLWKNGANSPPKISGPIH